MSNGQRIIAALEEALAMARADNPRVPESTQSDRQDSSSSQTIPVGRGALPTPADSSRCIYVLREQGAPYPRTCAVCMLGPCPFRSKSSAEQSAVEKSRDKHKDFLDRLTALADRMSDSGSRAHFFASDLRKIISDAKGEKT